MGSPRYLGRKYILRILGSNYLSRILRRKYFNHPGDPQPPLKNWKPNVRFILTLN
jgi:hypothetical protein